MAKAEDGRRNNGGNSTKSKTGTDGRHNNPGRPRKGQ